MQLAAHDQSGGSPSASFGALQFLGLWSSLLEIPHSGATLAHMEGEGGPCPWPPSRLAWGSSGETLLPPPTLQQGTCSLPWSRTYPQMHQRSLLPGEYSHTASCLGSPKCQKRLVNGLY